MTTALHVIEGMGMVRNTRGSIVVRDRAALEAFASDAYGIPELEYERIIGPLRKDGGAQQGKREPDSSVVAFRRTTGDD